jgi:hypothetical protein
MEVFTMNRVSIFLASDDVASLPDIDADATRVDLGGAATAPPPELCKLTDDLFGSAIAPPADARFDDVLYSRFRTELIQQYGAGTQDRRATIDAIALLRVQATRLYRLAERNWQPQVPPGVADKAHSASDYQSQQYLLERLVRACQARSPLNCSPEEAALVAPLLAQQVQNLIYNVAVAADVRAEQQEFLLSHLPEPDDDAMEAADREKLASLKPVRALLLDPARAEAVLRGERTLSVAQRDLLKGLLERAINTVLQKGRSAQEALRAFEIARHKSEAAWLREPRRLHQLYAMIDRVENEIRRRLKRLDKN